MNTYDSNSGSVLPAVRDYIKLLVVTVVILSISLIGYLYWLNNVRYRLESVANYYHLETILYCSQINEEMTHILPADTHSQLYMKRPSWQDSPQIARNHALYLMEEHIQAISEIHETYAAMSDKAANIEPIIRKARRQLARIKIALQEPGGTGMDVDPCAKPFIPLNW